MKRWTLCAMLLVSAAASAAPLQESYDKFKKDLIVLTEDMKPQMTKSGSNLRVYYGFIYHGSNMIARPVDWIALRFHSTSRGWVYLEDHRDLKIIVLADDDRLEIDASNYDGEVTSGANCVETFAAVLTPDDLKKILGAKRVEIQAGPNEFKFDDQLRKNLIKIAVRGQLIPKPEPAPVTVLFQQTPEYQSLHDAAIAATKKIDEEKAKALSAFYETPEFKKAALAVQQADQKKQQSSGQQRLDAAKEWLEAKTALEKLKTAAVDKSADVAAAKQRADDAWVAIETAKAEYMKHPTTRPGVAVDE